MTNDNVQEINKEFKYSDYEYTQTNDFKDKKDINIVNQNIVVVSDNKSFKAVFSRYI